MRGISILWLVIGVFWIQTSEAQRRTVLYEGKWHSVPCTVTVNWTNYAGLGPVTGEISISGGRTYAFTGSNYSTGRLDIKVPGDPNYRFIKRKLKGITTWVLYPGGDVFFSRRKTLSRPTVTTAKPAPGGDPIRLHSSSPDPETTFSKGTWGDRPVSVTINWDNFKGLGPVAGDIIYNNANYTFSGSHSRRGYMRLKIEGVKGYCYLYKTGTGPTSIWSGKSNGSLLSFSQSSSVVSSAGEWLIVCESESDKLTAEKKATAWRTRGFAAACVVEKSDFGAVGEDQDLWMTCVGQGSQAAMENLLPKVRQYYPDAYPMNSNP